MTKIPVCKDGKRHWWKDGWVCEKCGVRKGDILGKTHTLIDKCIWCGVEREKRLLKKCCAPDGDGHLFNGGADGLRNKKG